MWSQGRQYFKKIYINNRIQLSDLPMPNQIRIKDYPPESPFNLKLKENKFGIFFLGSTFFTILLHIWFFFLNLALFYEKLCGNAQMANVLHAVDHK